MIVPDISHKHMGEIPKREWLVREDYLGAHVWLIHKSEASVFIYILELSFSGTGVLWSLDKRRYPG
jgi:hypothetical protein